MARSGAPWWAIKSKRSPSPTIGPRFDFGAQEPSADASHCTELQESTPCDEVLVSGDESDLEPDGYLDRFAARGYVVEEP